MKIKEFINFLNQFPDDIDVCLVENSCTCDAVRSTDKKFLGNINVDYEYNARKLILGFSQVD